MERYIGLCILAFPVICLFVLIRAAIIQRKQYAENGRRKCSCCGKTPGIIYYYHHGLVTYYHCEEHFWYNHKTPPKDKKQ